MSATLASEPHRQVLVTHPTKRAWNADLRAGIASHAALWYWTGIGMAPASVPDRKVLQHNVCGSVTASVARDAMARSSART